MIYRVLGTLFGFILTVVLLFVMLKVNTSQEESIPISGTVLSVSEGPSFDVIIRLNNNPTAYYINRGTERGLIIDSLSTRLVGEKITFWVGDQLIGTPRHITHLEHDSVIYSEW